MCVCVRKTWNDIVEFADLSWMFEWYKFHASGVGWYKFLVDFQLCQVAFLNGRWTLDMFGWFFQPFSKLNNFPDWSLPSETDILGFHLVNDSIQLWISVMSRLVSFCSFQISLKSWVPTVDGIISIKMWFELIFQDCSKLEWNINEWNNVFFSDKKLGILSQQKIACQLQLHEPGVGPTACISAWSLRHAQCWFEPNRLRGGCVFLGLSEVEEVKPRESSHRRWVQG